MATADPTPGKSRLTKIAWLALSVLAVLATPAIVHQLLRWLHSREYHGACGPHATDVAARPCSYETYMGEFGQGFDGVGLLFIEAAAFVAAAVVVPLTWTLARALHETKGQPVAPATAPRPDGNHLDRQGGNP